MRRSLASCALSLLLVASAAACSDDDGSDGDAAPGSATSAVAPTGGDGGAEAHPTGVLTGDDPRATEVVEAVEGALPELDLQSVVFGVWVGDEEIARGALDAPGSPTPTPIDALVRVGQPMEAMLGTVVLQLDEEGVLPMDEPVGEHVPDLVNGDAITPQMLANSTSGTPDYVPDEDFQAAVYDNPFAGYTYDELLGYAQQTEPLFEPGTSWAYSHTDMATLVEVLEAATGQTLGELLAERIFEPLGMEHSTAHKDAEIGEPAFRAFTHERGVYEESTTWDPTWGLNGGMNASVADLGRWLRALEAGELLGDEDAELSLSPVTAGLGTMTEDRYFAFGSLVSGDWILGNPSLNGYQGFTAQHRGSSVTIVVWATSAFERSDESNASLTIGQRISEIVSDDPIVLPGS